MKEYIGKRVAVFVRGSDMKAGILLAVTKEWIKLDSIGTELSSNEGYIPVSSITLVQLHYIQNAAVKPKESWDGSAAEMCRSKESPAV